MRARLRHPVAEEERVELRELLAPLGAVPRGAVEVPVRVASDLVALADGDVDLVDARVDVGHALREADERVARRLLRAAVETAVLAEGVPENPDRSCRRPARSTRRSRSRRASRATRRPSPACASTSRGGCRSRRRRRGRTAGAASRWSGWRCRPPESSPVSAAQPVVSAVAVRARPATRAKGRSCMVSPPLQPPCRTGAPAVPRTFSHVLGVHGPVLAAPSPRVLARCSVLLRRGSAPSPERGPVGQRVGRARHCPRASFSVRCAMRRIACLAPLALLLALPRCSAGGPPLHAEPSHASLFGDTDVNISGDLASLGAIREVTVGGVRALDVRTTVHGVIVRIQGSPTPGPAEIRVVGAMGVATDASAFTFDAPAVPPRWMALAQRPHAWHAVVRARRARPAPQLRGGQVRRAPPGCSSRHRSSPTACSRRSGQHSSCPTAR